MGYTDETKIVEGIVRGDEATLKHFYNTNFYFIQNYVLNNSGSKEDAEDIFQDSLLILYQQIKSQVLDINCSISTYFQGVCRNVWRNRLRKNCKLVFRENITYTSDDLEQVYIDDMESKEQEHIYRKHFSRMDDKSRELLILFFEGKTAREIAVIMNCSEGAVRKRKFECKKILLEKIEGDPLYPELTVKKMPEKNKAHDVVMG